MIPGEKVAAGPIEREPRFGPCEAAHEDFRHSQRVPQDQLLQSQRLGCSDESSQLLHPFADRLFGELLFDQSSTVRVQKQHRVRDESREELIQLAELVVHLRQRGQLSQLPTYLLGQLLVGSQMSVDRYPNRDDQKIDAAEIVERSPQGLNLRGISRQQVQDICIEP